MELDEIYASLKAQTHQTDFREPAAMNALCCVTLVLAKKLRMNPSERLQRTANQHVRSVLVLVEMTQHQQMVEV